MLQGTNGFPARANSYKGSFCLIKQNHLCNEPLNKDEGDNRLALVHHRFLCESREWFQTAKTKGWNQALFFDLKWQNFGKVKPTSETPTVVGLLLFGSPDTCKKPEYVSVGLGFAAFSFIGLNGVFVSNCPLSISLNRYHRNTQR